VVSATTVVVIAAGVVVDLLAARLDVCPGSVVEVAAGSASPHAAASTITAASRGPVFIAGNGIRSARTVDPLSDPRARGLTGAVS
jgi:hypothetical protein